MDLVFGVTMLTHHTTPVTKGSARTPTWPQLTQGLSAFKRAAAKDKTGAWSPARFMSRAEVEAACQTDDERADRLRGGGAVSRSAANVIEVSCLVADIDDGGRAALDAVSDRLQRRGVLYWWHTTFTSAENYRVVVPLSRPVPRAQWWDFWHWGLKSLGAKASADPSCKDPSRLYYLPGISPDRDDEGACGGVLEGRTLDVEKILELGPYPIQPVRTSGRPPKVYPAASETVLWAASMALEAHGDAIEGKHGDTRTFVAAAMLIHDWALTVDEAWPILARWNTRHAQPPWGEPQLREKLRNSGTYAKGEYGGARDALTPYQLEVKRVEAELADRMGEPAMRTEPAQWTNGQDLLGMEFPKAAWIVRGLLAENTVTVIGADPKASKTWTLIDLALAVSGGGSALGAFPSMVPPSVVFLFLNEDGKRSVKNRLRALCAGYGYDAERANRIEVRCREQIDLTNRQQVAQFIVDVRMTGVKPAFIGLDPLRNLHPAEENSGTEMQPVLRAVGAIRDLCGCAVVVVHHSAKKGGADDRRTAGARLRGSSAIDGFRDGLISLEETEKGEGGDVIANQVVVDLKAFRGAGRFPLTLRIEDDENGEAIRAVWAKDATLEAAERSGRPLKSTAELEEQILRWFKQRHAEALVRGLEFKPYESSVSKQLQSVIGKRRDAVEQLIADMVERSSLLVREPVLNKRGEAYQHTISLGIRRMETERPDEP